MAVAEKKEKVRDSLIEDCFGVVAGKKHCHILTEDVCIYGDCPFYKTREQFDADRKKYDRVCSSRCVRESISRKIRCIDTGKIYVSISAAARELGISEGALSLTLKGKQKSTYGMRFEYV